MRLILLPDEPGDDSGGAKLVKSDLARLDASGDDLVVVRSSSLTTHQGFSRISPPSRRSLKRMTNLARFRVSYEATPAELRPFARYRFDEIFCGGVELYRATRKVFPRIHLTVRFHNLFSLIQARRRSHSYPVDPIFAVNLATYPGLERAVFRDPNVSLIFATDADQAFHALQFPNTPSTIWSIDTQVSPTVREPTRSRLIHYGGVSVHKAAALRYFISEVFLELHRREPEIELHLHGRGTEQLHDAARGVYGHGRFDGSSLPHDGDGLFVNPDLLGGGIKIKVGDWLEWGVPFISTPFGVDGYHFEPSRHRMVAPIEAWSPLIHRYFSDLGVLRTERG